EYLQAANVTLEQKAEAAQQRKQDASSQAADLSAKNQELCQELGHIDHLAQQLEMDKELALQTADQELREARDQSEGDYEQDRLRDQLEEAQQQRDKMEGLVNFMEQEKARLQDKRSPSRLDAFVRSLEEERDHYRQEAQHYKRVRRPQGLSLSPNRSPERSPVHSPVRGSSPSSRRGRAIGETELVRVAKERDNLKSVLLGFERHMEDIQTDVQALHAERDQLKAQVQEELLLARSAAVAPEDVTRLRRELEQADAELQLVTSERDVLLERLKSSTLTDRLQEDRRILDLEDNIKSLERDRRDLRAQLLVLKENREAAEEELQTRSSALVHSAEEVAQHRAESSAL
ncbi:hypothetical protein CRUP_015102, partial [Coryphaenoides rupestris]